MAIRMLPTDCKKTISSTDSSMGSRLHKFVLLNITVLNAEMQKKYVIINVT